MKNNIPILYAFAQRKTGLNKLPEIKYDYVKDISVISINRVIHPICKINEQWLELKTSTRETRERED